MKVACREVLVTSLLRTAARRCLCCFVLGQVVVLVLFQPSLAMECLLSAQASVAPAPKSQSV